MRGQSTIEDQVEQLKEYLDCPCAYYPASGDSNVLLSDFAQARARGKEEGFIPMLVAVDEMLLESFSFSAEGKSPQQVRQELLDFPLESGEALLQKWLSGAKEGWKEVDPEFYANWDANVIGEMAGGDEINRFLSLCDNTGKQIIPIVLAEIPVKNPWEVFAWLPFGGWNECPAPEEHMAVAKYWFAKFGAIPALMTPDVLEYTIPFFTSVPSWQAGQLALEQYAYCSDIVDQGVGTIGRLADGLTKSHYWYFWWD